MISTLPDQTEFIRNRYASSKQRWIEWEIY